MVLMETESLEFVTRQQSLVTMMIHHGATEGAHHDTQWKADPISEWHIKPKGKKIANSNHAVKKYTLRNTCKGRMPL
jgi:hypothetical protein